MGFLYAIVGAIVTGIVKAFFGDKTTEQKAVDTLLAEKELMIKKVEDAKIIKTKLDTDPDFRQRLRNKYTRTENDD